MIHGGGYKPTAAELAALWQGAIGAGLDRDHGDAGGRALLDNVRLELVYYGDLANPVISAAGQAPDPALDLTDRRRDLERLARLSSRKKFRRMHYEALPGKSAVGEFLADVSAPLLGGRVGRKVLERRFPVLIRYLDDADGLREACEARLLESLLPAFERGDDVLLLSHGLGSVIGYDALWRLSHDAELAATAPAMRTRTWITMGSPLASEFVKRRLRGAGAPAASRYPGRLTTWLNVAAEDDFQCHDKTVANDYEALLRQRRLSRIHDYRIYNLALRYGRSNPHSAVGYLVHPRVSRLLADWLQDRPED